MTDKRLALTTCGSAADAEKLAKGLLERRLAACVNVLPAVRSFYWWKGKVENDEEHLLLIKTRNENLEALQQALLELHSYDTPEFIVLPIESGSAAYLRWIDESLA